jgi:hypothetical protein
MRVQMLNRCCVFQRTAWFPPIGTSATSEAAEEAALQSLSLEQAAVLQAQEKKQVLSQLRQRLAKMTGKPHRSMGLDDLRTLPHFPFVELEVKMHRQRALWHVDLTCSCGVAAQTRSSRSS